MITKTQALALRITPFSRTSHIVTWLTSEHGKVGTIIKGACRPKSLFLGQYDLFDTCELLYYTRERNGLHIAKECSSIILRRHFKADWRSASCASYICDMLSKLTLHGDAQPEFYRLANMILDLLSEHPFKPQIIFWFELKILTLSGVAPSLQKCTSCGCTLSSFSSFSAAKGGILCPNCNDGTGIYVPPNILAMLKTWQNTSPRTCYNTKCSLNQLLDFHRILGKFLEYHLDILPDSRNIAFEMTIRPFKCRPQKAAEELG